MSSNIYNSINEMCSGVNDNFDINQLRFLVKLMGIMYIDGVLIDFASKEKLCSIVSLKLKELKDKITTERKDLLLDPIVKNENSEISFALGEHPDSGIHATGELKARYPENTVNLEFVYQDPIMVEIDANVLNSGFINGALAHPEMIKDGRIKIPADIVDPGTFARVYDILERLNGGIFVSYDEIKSIENDENVLKMLDYLSIDKFWNNFVKLYIFGFNEEGQLGVGDLIDREEPTLITSLPAAIEIVKISLGTWSAILTGEGQVLYFGVNDVITPEVLNLPPCIDISCGLQLSIFITEKGEAYALGHNRRGERGTGEIIDPREGNWEQLFSEIPIKINVPPCISVSCGEAHTAFLTKDGRVYTAGNNNKGQLGLGDTTDRFVPTLIPNLSNCIAVACGDRHTCILTGDGKLHCCGFNVRGQLGIGSYENAHIPTLIVDDPNSPGLAPIIKVSCGDVHTLVLTENGDVYTFGDNSNGQLGNVDETVNTPTKFRILPEFGTSFIDISCGGEETMILTSEENVIMLPFNNLNLPRQALQIAQGSFHSAILCRW